MPIRFEAFELDRRLGRLLGPEGEIRLRPQAFRVLLALVEEAPRIVSGDELMDRAWDGTFVSASSVRQTLSELRQALGDDPRTPRIIETVHRRGYRMIAPLEDLPRTAGTTSKPPLPPTAGTDPLPGGGLGPRKRRFLFLAMTVILLFPTPISVPESSPPPRIGARDLAGAFSLELENLSGDPQLDWMAGAVEELLLVELAVLDSIAALDPREPSPLDPPAVFGAGEGLRRSLSAHPPPPPGLVASGSFLTFSSDPRQRFHLQIQLRDATTGAALGWARESGLREDLPQVVRRLARSIAAAAGGRQGPLDRAVGAQLDLASSTESLRLFAEAMAWIRRSDDSAARPLLEKAVAVDPDNPLHREALAAVYQNLGLLKIAREQAILASRLAEGLPTEQRLLIAARRDMVQGDLEEATARLRTLHRQFPFTSDYGLQLSSALLRSGRLEEALAIAQRMEGDDGPAGSDIRPSLVKLKILMVLNRLRDAELAARRLMEPEVKQDLSAGATETGLQQLFRLHLRLGEVEEAKEILDALSEIPPDPRDPHRDARILLSRGSLVGHQGLLAEGEALFRGAASRFRDLGDPSSEAACLNLLGSLLRSSGLESEAIPSLERAIALNRQARNAPGLAVSLSLLASAQASLGRLEEARRAIDEALLLNRAMDDRRRKGLGLRSLAGVLMAEGRLEEAAVEYRQALRLGQEIGDRESAGQATRGLGVIALRQGRLEEARHLLTRAAAEFETLRHLPQLLGTQILIAELALTSSDPADSRRIYSDVLRRTRGTSLSHYEDLARLGLGKVAVREGI